MIVNVLIANIVTLHPLKKHLTPNLEVGVLYTYHSTCAKNGEVLIFIDQTQDWYPKHCFKDHDLCYN